VKLNPSAMRPARAAWQSVELQIKVIMLPTCAIG